MSSPLTELIGSGEGNYNSYNGGTYKDEQGKYIVIPANQTFDFSQMSIADIQRHQALPVHHRDRMYAVGKYQFIPKTLEHGISHLKIDSSEKFTPELQDRLFNEYVLPSKRPQIYAYITGRPGVSLRDAQKATCQEWASVEDPDTPGHVYANYEKYGNKMHTTAAQVAAALDEMRLEYQAQIDKGLSAETAWRATMTMGPGQLQHIAKAHVDRSIASKMLTEGAYGPAVAELQTHLRQLGYVDAQGRPLATDNHFGANTRRAVEAFQRDHGLSVDGVAGPNTWTALRDATRAASIAQSPIAFPQIAAPDLDAATITTLQRQLQTLGMSDHRGQPLPVTGIYDDVTRVTLMMFQKEQGLPGTGAPDPATRALIEARATIAELRQIERERPVPIQDVSRREDVRMPAVAANVAAYPNDAANPHRTSQTAILGPGLDDPRNALNPHHALYNELHRRIPEASEKRLLQFTAACHSHDINVDNLAKIYFDRQNGTMTFSTSWPPIPSAVVDLKVPSPEPQQSIQHIHQYDEWHAQMMGDIRAHRAQVEAQAQQGPVMGGSMR
jgi:peptidoglycan hydrolase-like protein with peptidoglycan-binding domain